MHPWHLLARLVCWLLLTAPIDTSPLVEVLDRGLCLRVQLQALALEQELLDPRESHYLLARPEEIASDLRLVRRRYQDLHDAPPLHDAMMWPDRELVNALLGQNRQYRQWLTAQIEMGGPDAWQVREVIGEVDQLYALWDTVRDAKCEWYYLAGRRQALKRLREELGHEAYHAGRLPPCVPVWRFREIR